MVKKGDGGSGLGKALLKTQRAARRGPKPNAEGYLHSADMQVHFFLFVSLITLGTFVNIFCCCTN